MKTLLYVLTFASIAASAAPNFVTPNMVKRNGLTDEQYQQLWSQGKHPSIDQAAARDWIFRSSRYVNVTNWLDVIGKTNNFAALASALNVKNIALDEANQTLSSSNSVLRSAYALATAQAELAQAKINDEIEDLSAKITKYTEYQSKYPLLKTVWAALITDAQNRIKILEALAK